LSRISGHSRQLAEEAARRGWRYSPSGDDLQLSRRWRWSVRFDHPFAQRGHGSGLDRRTPPRDVLSGATPAGWPFWSFWFPYEPGAHGSFVTRSVAFIDTARPLPAVSALRRGGRGTRPIMSALNERAARQAGQWPGDDARVQATSRRLGWAVGSDQFRRAYLVKADDRRGADWLASPQTQQQLLASPAVSLTTNGADILAWCDHPGPHISRIEDYDIATVEAMLDVLDAIDLAPQRARPPSP
jgi:hypothetical protein